MNSFVYYPHDVCRVCLIRKGKHSLFRDNILLNKQLVFYADALMNICSVLASRKDGLPQKICKQCLHSLLAALRFKTLCEESYAKLLAQSQSTQHITSRKDHNIVNAVKNESDINDLADSKTIFDNEYTRYGSDNENFSNLENASPRNIKLENDMYSKCASEENISNNAEDPSDTQNKVQNDSKSTSTINDEEENVAGERYYCKLSQKHFSSEAKHKLSHVAKGHFQCEQCPKIFMRVSTLNSHLLTHTGELPFKCAHPGCSKAFPVKSRLSAHVKVHTNERPFICQYCSHAARDKQQLTVHIRYFHTKEKNFKCKVCGKAFVSPQARYYHAKRHENIRNHHCTHCERSFVFAFGLQEHLLTHTGEKRFACAICDSRFGRKAHKLKHEASVHGLATQPSIRPPKVVSAN